MRDDAEVTRHQILGLGHDSLARRRHSVRPTLGCRSLGVWRSDGPGGRIVAVSLAPGLDRSCLQVTFWHPVNEKSFAIAIM